MTRRKRHRAVKAARAAGIEPVLYVNGFPAWSNGGADPTWVAYNPTDYGDFMAAAVRRYPQVRRWIAFAEPSHALNFKPQGEGGRRAPRLYARLLDAAYEVATAMVATEIIGCTPSHRQPQARGPGARAFAPLPDAACPVSY